MKKRFAAVLAAAVTALSLFASMPLTAWAANGSVSVSSASVSPGETVNISVSVNCDSSLGAAVVNVTYDPSILQFNGASGALGGSGGGGGVSFAWYASGEGTTSVSSTLSFTAIGSGTSGVSVSGADVVAWDETAVPVGIGNGSVTVSAPEPAQPTQPAQPDQPSQPTQPAQPTQPTQPADPNQPTTEAESETPPPVNEDLTLEIDGRTWYIVEELNADYLPDGFEAVSLNYGEGQTAIEVGKALHADAYLFRVADENQNNGHFLVWDESSDSFSPLVMINGTHAVIPLTNAAGVPEGFAETEIEVNVTENENGGEAVTNADGEETGETVPAYTADVIQAWKAGNGTDDDFALVHVVNPDGELGFYRYDAREQTLQRYVRETLEAPQEPETEEETLPPAVIEPEPVDHGLKDKILPIGLGAAAAA
ncbi:MAG: hypothetical protein IIZ51_08800, partial [Lachnospiraceae bacterium]|nr:hypothetical protein [Lachnospiraceae bacterium]